MKPIEITTELSKYPAAMVVSMIYAKDQPQYLPLQPILPATTFAVAFGDVEVTDGKA